MNFILLLFVILATTFVTSSAGNIFKIFKALDYYFDKAGVGNYIILTMNDRESDDKIEALLGQSDYVEEFTKDACLMATKNNFKLKDGSSLKFDNPIMLIPDDIKQQKFFDSGDHEITKIHPGEIYLKKSILDMNGLSKGDVILFSAGSFELKLKIADYCKDAAFGGAMMGIARFLINKGDLQTIREEETLPLSSVYSAKLNDNQAFSQEYNKADIKALLHAEEGLLRMAYVMDLVIAGALLVVSICLILISFVILRFTILFTIHEDFREIGIMKAIGIKESMIRIIYMEKYLAIGTLGAVIGYFFSLVFSGWMLQQVSQNIVMDIRSSTGWLGIFCMILILALIGGFSFLCTGKIHKLSPMEAVRNGASGERFHGKGRFRLHKTRLFIPSFLAVNDITSDLKKYGTLLLSFTLGVLLVIIPINTINTLRSASLVKAFHMVESDLYLNDDALIADFISTGERDEVSLYLKNMETILRENDLEAKVFMEMAFPLSIRNGDRSENVNCIQGNGVESTGYDYIEGSAPVNENEIAITKVTAAALGAVLGDTVFISMNDGEKPYLITAYFQTMTNMGQGVRFNESEEIDYHLANGSLAMQIQFLNERDRKDIGTSMEKVKELFPDFSIRKGEEFIDKMTGGIAKQIDSVKQLILLLVILINVLVVVLMQRIFIIKDSGEIAILKAVGFPDRSILFWLVERIGFILAASVAIGSILSGPLTRISSGRVFQMMGAPQITFVIKPLEAYIIYPLIIFLCTIAFAILGALRARKIPVQETNQLE